MVPTTTRPVLSALKPVLGSRVSLLQYSKPSLRLYSSQRVDYYSNHTGLAPNKTDAQAKRGTNFTSDQRPSLRRPVGLPSKFNSSSRAYISTSIMQSLVYKGKGQLALEDHPVPQLQEPTDAIVKVLYTTICGTDLHIMHGDVPTVTPGRILGHEGVGIVQEPGAAVSRFKKGDHVLINCITSCATCEYCRRGMYSHCTQGGWILGNTIDGTQAEYVRIPQADSSLHHVPEGVDEKSLVMFSDIFPTGLECGVLNSKVQPGSSVAIVGAGPVGLAALMTSKLYSPSTIIVIDKDPKRLEVAKKLGADHIVNSGETSAEEVVMRLTNKVGCDAVIEAVGVAATLEMAQDLVAPGGTIANVGVHGTSCTLKIEKLWDRNMSLTTRLVDTVTTPMLLKLFAAGGIQPGKLITHELPFKEMEKAYTTFKAAAEHEALKMLITI